MDSVSVLLIEDHEGEARLNQRMLERSHTMEFRFTSLRSLAEARDVIKHASFDVLLLDLNLTDSSGIETYETMQSLAPTLPIVIISAVSDERLAVECIRRGAQDYLIKGSITSETMTRVVRHAMARMGVQFPRQVSANTSPGGLPAVSFRLDEQDRLVADHTALAALADIGSSLTAFPFVRLFLPTVEQNVHKFVQGVRSSNVAMTAVFELSSPAKKSIPRVLVLLHPPGENAAGTLDGVLIPSHPTLSLNNDDGDSESKYHTLVEHIQDGALIAQDSTLRYVNQALADILGYEIREMIGASILDFIAPEHREDVQENHLRRMAGENIQDVYECALLHRSGERRQVQLSMGRIPFQDGYASMGTVKDVTQQHRVAYLMRIQHQLAIDLAYASDIETVFDHIVSAVLRVDSVDATAIFICRNNAAESDLTLSRGVHDVFLELQKDETYRGDLHRTLRERTASFQNSEEVNTLTSATVMKEQGIRSLGLIPIIRAGETIAALGVASLTYNTFGSLVRQTIEAIASYLGGVLARLAAEESLRDSELLYRAVVEKSHDAVFIYREDHLVFANERTSELTGYSRDDLRSMNAWSLIHPEDRARIQQLSATREQDGDSPLIYEGRILTKDGTIRTGEFAATMIRYHSDAAALVTVRDVTSRRSHEQELKRSDSLLRAAGFAASRFLHTDSWEECILEVLERYGSAANVCRVVLMENISDDDGSDRMLQRNVWVRPEMRDSMIERVPDGFDYSEPPYSRWAARLSSGSTIAAVLDSLDADEQMVLARQNIRSTAMVPVFNGDHWWGFIRFDECRLRRTWLESELDAMGVGARTLGAAINRQQASEEILAAKERAEQADEMKKAFIANMSHEVRTPLNIILGYLVLVTELADPEVNEEVHEFFHAIEDATARLIRTVDSIMNISRFQANDIAIEQVPLRLDKLVNNCMEKFRRLAEEKELLLEFQNSLGEVEVLADQNYLTESLDHLIDNAIKFTPSGKVTVQLERSEDDGPLLSISDTGIGISKEFLNRMYEPYVQEDTGYDRGYEGIGLGLTLVKLYIEAHGASIDVASRKGEGTTFSVQFPREST